MATVARTPAFAGYFERDKTDLFGESSTPREIAIDRVLGEAVEYWIAGEMHEAAHLTRTGEKYLIMSDSEFANTSSEGE